MRRRNEIQLEVDELKEIIWVLKRKRPCNFLVFGLGNDSLLWSKANHKGQTVFIENDPAWYATLTGRYAWLAAHKVDYQSRLGQWRGMLDSAEVFNLALPFEVVTEKWDVILVDAPAGWNDSGAGRMKSIAAASRLAGESSDVFVHDCDRIVERTYCDKYLKAENQVSQVGKLRHYILCRSKIPS
jgi:glucuronoxylan 4-O-methyltransferase